MADEGKNTMSLAGFREIIATQPNPALVIWGLVASYIDETENRIIDAEFAKTEAENKLAALSAKSL